MFLTRQRDLGYNLVGQATLSTIDIGNNKGDFAEKSKNMNQVREQEQQAGLFALRKLAKDLSSCRDSSALFKTVLTSLLNIFRQADAGAVFLYRQASDRLVVEYATGYDTDAMYRTSFQVDEGIVGKAFSSKQVGLYSTPEMVAEAMANMTSQNCAYLSQALLNCKQPQSVLAFPLICGDVTIGAVILENWRGHQWFSQADLRLAEALVDVMSLAACQARLHRQLELESEALEKTTMLQQEVMSTLAHEMRTPLASIKGYASALLLEEVQWDEETKREYLQVIVEQSDALSEIIADLLEASLIDAGRLEIQKEPVLLPRLAQEVVDQVAQYTDKHRFVVSFSPGFPVVDADSGHIRRVLFNLLDNAIKYSPEGGLVVVHGETSESEAIISVADQGQGIAPEHLNRLFERFFRVKFVTGYHVAGSGLGLPIARNIVEAHGGRIWAESKVGEGTKIYFTLPLRGLSAGIEVSNE